MTVKTSVLRADKQKKCRQQQTEKATMTRQKRHGQQGKESCDQANLPQKGGYYDEGNQVPHQDALIMGHTDIQPMAHLEKVAEMELYQTNICVVKNWRLVV
jgi:hypothetical protein